jgi:hypothetical protein
MLGFGSVGGSSFIGVRIGGWWGSGVSTGSLGGSSMGAGSGARCAWMVAANMVDFSGFRSQNISMQGGLLTPGWITMADST